MRIELALDHLLRRLHNRVADLRIEMAKRHVRFGRGPFHDAQRPHDGKRLLLPADLEIAQAALRLRAPIAVGSNLDGTERVGLDACFGHVSRPRD